eukprot:248450-Prorocentrum_minimum.AAC.2
MSRSAAPTSEGTSHRNTRLCRPPVECAMPQPPPPTPVVAPALSATSALHVAPRAPISSKARRSPGPETSGAARVGGGGGVAPPGLPLPEVEATAAEAITCAPLLTITRTLYRSGSWLLCANLSVRAGEAASSANVAPSAAATASAAVRLLASVVLSTLSPHHRTALKESTSSGQWYVNRLWSSSMRRYTACKQASAAARCSAPPGPRVRACSSSRDRRSRSTSRWRSTLPSSPSCMPSASSCSKRLRSAAANARAAAMCAPPSPSCPRRHHFCSAAAMEAASPSAASPSVSPLPSYPLPPPWLPGRGWTGSSAATARARAAAAAAEGDSVGSSAASAGTRSTLCFRSDSAPSSEAAPERLRKSLCSTASAAMRHSGGVGPLGALSTASIASRRPRLRPVAQHPERGDAVAAHRPRARPPHGTHRRHQRLRPPRPDHRRRAPLRPLRDRQQAGGGVPADRVQARPPEGVLHRVRVQRVPDGGQHRQQRLYSVGLDQQLARVQRRRLLFQHGGGAGGGGGGHPTVLARHAPPVPAKAARRGPRRGPDAPLRGRRGAGGVAPKRGRVARLGRDEPLAAAPAADLGPPPALQGTRAQEGEHRRGGAGTRLRGGLPDVAQQLQQRADSPGRNQLVGEQLPGAALRVDGDGGGGPRLHRQPPRQQLHQLGGPACLRHRQLAVDPCAGECAQRLIGLHLAQRPLVPLHAHQLLHHRRPHQGRVELGVVEQVRGGSGAGQRSGGGGGGGAHVGRVSSEQQAHDRGESTRLHQHHAVDAVVQRALVLAHVVEKYRLPALGQVVEHAGGVDGYLDVGRLAQHPHRRVHAAVGLHVQVAGAHLRDVPERDDGIAGNQREDRGLLRPAAVRGDAHKRRHALRLRRLLGAGRVQRRQPAEGLHCVHHDVRVRVIQQLHQRAHAPDGADLPGDDGEAGDVHVAGHAQRQLARGVRGVLCGVAVQHGVQHHQCVQRGRVAAAARRRLRRDLHLLPREHLRDRRKRTALTFDERFDTIHVFRAFFRSSEGFRHARKRIPNDESGESRMLRRLVRVVYMQVN